MSNCFMSPSSRVSTINSNNKRSDSDIDNNNDNNDDDVSLDYFVNRTSGHRSNKSIINLFSNSMNVSLNVFAWLSLVFLVFLFSSNQIHALNSHSSNTVQNVGVEIERRTGSGNIAKYRSIQLFAFERTFKLNLKLIPSDEFLSPGLESSNNKERQTNRSNGCFYRGIVDDDVQSIAYINLCHKGHVIGSFDVNNNEYFIEPIEEFDASTYEKNEFSFVDFDLGGEPLKTHLLVKTKSSGKEASSSSKKPIVSASPSQSATSSCGLDDTDSSNNKNASTAAAKRRSKRRVVPPSAASAAVVDRRLYLELLVVVDRKMFEYYDTNLENHILTLMFMVTQMYQHSSLINPIRVYITDIIYLHKLEERKYRPSFETEWEAEKTLNKFCEWQHEYKREANIKDKVDATILITKTDICKSINVCQTLGMARLNQICVSGQSCAVIEDSGINTAYTIAHEIGHLLGMKHVDEERCQGIDNKTTQMMASMLDLTKKSHAWSNCSVEDLNAFLRTGDAECLFNVPDKSPNFANRTLLSFDDTNEQFDERTILNALYPGSLQAYEIKHQCQQIFGPRSDACEQHLDDDCKILWCKSYETYSPEVAVHCVTTNTKWADGTPCGLSEYNTVPKICMNGECVSKSDSRALKEDGQWGSWSEFTPCSRSCGGGVRKRYRSCDNPKPKNGGKYCVGDRYHYESCNIQDCKLDESSFRDEQCRMAVQEISPQKMRDQMGFITNNTFLWKAYYSHDPRRKCILFCKLEDRPNFAMLRPMVVDGTKCGLNTFDICVNGHCLPGGCDNVLYSNKQNDNCGVCAGGNKSCQRTNYTLDTPNHFGYNKLSVIPPKSTNIFIHRQRDGDDLGCLVIRSASSFLLNGHYVISKTSTSIKFEGKFIDYIVNDTDEIIKSPGNFSQQLEIQFLAGSKKIYNNIKFIYHTPIITVAPRRPNGDQNRQAKSNSNPEIASAETSPSSSYSIGSGSSGHPGSARKAAFMRSQHQHREEDEVIRANNYKMPELFEKNITRVGQCDKLCNGVQIVYLNRCKKSGDECKPMQPETRSCNTECDLRVLASQGRCTPNVGDCGSGKLDVKVECIKIDKQSNLTRQVDLFHCDSNEVRSVYELYKNSQCYFPCDNFDWKLADSMCSCENGFKKQVYQCHDRLTNEVVNENKCQNRPKPKQDRVKCEVYCYKWRSGYWSECSKSCGTGVRYRTKYCIFNSTQIVDASYCKTSLPSSSQQEQSTNTIEYEYCNTEDCPQWSTSGWSLCSASSCGQTGKRQRRVTCLFKSSEVEANKCSSPAPTDSEDCLLDCDGVWRTSDWSECSVTCERGVRTRSVYCERKNGGGSNSDPMCDTKTRPTNSTECLIDEKCPKWIISSWSSCRGHCSGVGAQNGFRTRTVLCSTGTNSCDHLPKPLNFENCSLNCAHSRQWRAEEWSECNGDCNFGWKFRKVSCVDENNKPVSASECSMKDQPERRQRCMSCNGVWKAGQWDKCSNPCGKGVQTRLVECRAAFTNELLPASKCNPNSKMSDQRPCEELACKDELTFDWQIVSKGDCSVTCGLGWRLRRFECKNSRTNQTTTTNKCRSETQPTYYEQCNAGECPHWQHGGWSVCSSDCGEGHRRRLVACMSPTGNTIEDRACSAASRPHDQEKCVSSCTKNSRWISGSWSDCDYRTCTKVRSVVCAHENGTRAQSETDCSRTEKPNYIAECDSRASCKHYQVTFSQPSTTTTTANMGHIHYTAWSSCSAKCGPGWRTRRAVCKSTQANDSTEIDMRYCGGARDIREPLVKDCNVAQCFYKVVEIWSQCSSSCGQQGLETLERRCFETVSRNFTDPVNCGIYPNVTKTVTRSCYRPCVRHVRHPFEWRATDWKPCSAKCGFGYKNRTIYCWSQQENKKANESYCVARNKPASTLPCMNVSCGFGWFVSEWSTCSKNCSTGIKSREVICAKVSKEGHILNVTSNKCNMAEKPAHRITCNYGDCGGTYFWKPAKWSKCQPSCGFGYQKRTISCVDRFGNVQKDVGLCRKNSMPVTSQFCFTNCHMTSCSKLRSLFGVTKDGDYDLRISDKVVSIYCKSMNTTKPKEYITLKSGESQNFAEIYDKKLLEPSKCRIGPKYGGYCSFCKNETLENHGIVLFSKVRFDVKTLTVIDDDFSFTNVIYGNPVPYGHSGDCYSSLPECQHARFNINFKGTGLVIDNSVKWINYGDKPHSKIVYAKDHSSVYGTCGGLCGFCRPDPQTGLKLRVV